jgi:hypothetical protein
LSDEKKDGVEGVAAAAQSGWESNVIIVIVSVSSSATNTRQLNRKGVGQKGSV